MTYRDWLPSLWDDDKGTAVRPFSDLRKRIDSLFEDFDSPLQVGGPHFMAIARTQAAADAMADPAFQPLSH